MFRKSAFQRYELKTYFHGFLTIFYWSENFPKIFPGSSENLGTFLCKFSQNIVFGVLPASGRVFFRAFESVELLELSSRSIYGNIRGLGNPYEDRLSTNQIRIQPVWPPYLSYLDFRKLARPGLLTDCFFYLRSTKFGTLNLPCAISWLLLSNSENFHFWRHNNVIWCFFIGERPQKWKPH